mmetsp:Transcript_20971/g.29935  ORF Transcript_20971/g.29935 Transcript_20971/m.29935 type:complete len:86 (+) Transcript_20971:420-677(+)
MENLKTELELEHSSGIMEHLSLVNTPDTMGDSKERQESEHSSSPLGSTPDTMGDWTKHQGSEHLLGKVDCKSGTGDSMKHQISEY